MNVIKKKIVLKNRVWYRYNTGIYTGTGPVFWVPVFFVKYRNYRYFPVFFFILAFSLFQVRNAPGSEKRTKW